MDVASMGLAGQIAWFEHLAASGVDKLEAADGLAVAGGTRSNCDNGIIVTRSVLDDESALELLIDWMLDQQLPASLIVSEPVSLARLRPVIDRGLSAENSSTDMGATIANIEIPASSASPADIIEATDAATLRDGLIALGDDWYEPAEVDRRVELDRQIGFGPSAVTRHWVAYDRGTAVAMATSFIFDTTVVLMHCGVTTSHRRRGIATALTAARVSAALEHGCRFAVLSPSPDGYLLHSKLGFRSVQALRNRWFYLPMAVTA